MTHSRHLAAAKRAAIAAAYNANSSRTRLSIAAEFGISLWTVSKVLWQLDVPLKGQAYRRGSTHPNAEAARQLHRENPGLAVRQISIRTGVPFTTCRRLLKDPVQLSPEARLIILDALGHVPHDVIARTVGCDVEQVDMLAKERSQELRRKRERTKAIRAPIARLPKPVQDKLGAALASHSRPRTLVDRGLEGEPVIVRRTVLVELAA